MDICVNTYKNEFSESEEKLSNLCCMNLTVTHLIGFDNIDDFSIDTYNPKDLNETQKEWADQLKKLKEDQYPVKLN